MNSKICIRHLTLVFFVLAIVLRLMPHSYNFAAVGALGLFVGCMWSGRMGFLFVLAAMSISDVIGHALEIESMGFYSPGSMLAVYLAMACAALVGKLLAHGTAKGIPMWAGVPLGAIASAVVFFSSVDGAVARDLPIIR